MPGRDGTKGISGGRNSMHKGREAWTSKISNLLSQAFGDTQGSIPPCPLSTYEVGLGMVAEELKARPAEGKGAALGEEVL